MPDFVSRRRQILTFLVVGALTALLDVGLMKLLLLRGAPVLLATSVGFGAGLLFNLTCHARYTFESRLDAGTIARYLCVVALNYGLTLACVWTGMHLGADALAGKVVSLFLVPVSGFILGKYWIFRPGD